MFVTLEVKTIPIIVGGNAQFQKVYTFLMKLAATFVTRHIKTYLFLVLPVIDIK